MEYLLDESSHQKYMYLLPDGSAFLLIKSV
jgi:hypothetical protein